jgi:hypothetical protein
MNTKPDPAGAPADKNPRDALEESFEKSTAQEPENFPRRGQQGESGRDRTGQDACADPGH